MRRSIVLMAAVVCAAVFAQDARTPIPLRAPEALAHIKQTIVWYRHVTAIEQTPALAGDVLLRDSTHTSALKALQLVFDFGHAAATLLTTNAAAPGAAPAPTGNLAQAAARAAARVADLQNRVKDLDAAETKARTDAARNLARAQRSAVEAELNLAIQVRDTVNTLAAFSPATGSGSLGPQVDELERSVPEAAHPHPVAGQTSGAPAPAMASVAPGRPESTGIIGLATQLFTLARNRGQLRTMIAGTDDLVKSLNQIRAPMVNEVRAVVRRSEELGTISGDESAAQLASDQRDIVALQSRFKQLAAVVVPLGEQNIVLGTVRGNLAQGLDAVSAQYSETGRYLLLRLGLLGVAIGLVVLVSSLWRRVTFRYVRDARRRTQFLTLRRVVVACAITIVVVLSFVSEFGSLATYAGLLTAGIAVALQNVILSIVAYFFLIGRYGVRAGDRVTISGVTGTVIDIGLVRIYLAELAGTGGELHPTGRIVVYSNSVLFQPAALFKQMPETDYVWHTVRLVLTPESDFQLAETRISAAVNSVFEKYRPHIMQQHAKFERAVDAQMAQPQPETRLRYTDAGLEAMVYYPAQMKDAAVADAEIVRAIHDAIAGEPKLGLAPAGTPRIVANAA